LYQTLKRTLAQATENGWVVAFVLVDLDRFKDVNDTLGHAGGDELLARFSSRLLQCVRIRDTVGPLGGDEFAVILMMQDDEQGATLVATKIRAALRAPFAVGRHDVTLTASIGIAVYPDDCSDPETLMKYADTAMCRAKGAGRDTICFFTAGMNTEVQARFDLETALRGAILNREFELHYQPKVDLSSGRIVGAEALLRWRRPGVTGLVSPGEFIPIMEETGLIVDVGRWVIGEACRQIVEWTHSSLRPVSVSINVSGRQFAEGDLELDVTRALVDHHISAELLELELTEGSLMVDTARTITMLKNVQKVGVKISIDDFGTGYSSLSYLRRFPIDKLKIDIAFIRHLITQTVRNYAASLGLAILGTILVSQFRSRVTASLISQGASGRVASSEASRISQSQSGGSVASIPRYVRLDFAYASRSVFYVMAGIMATAAVAALIGLEPGLQPQETETGDVPAGA
jgi:diguanylate cyclase (GGDEF)-like protein